MLADPPSSVAYNVYVCVLTDKPVIWQSGFFDQNSWNETLHPWAQTVVVGRARYVSQLLICKSVENRKKKTIRTID